MVQPRIWFKEEPSQFTVGKTAQSLIRSIMEKPHTGLVEYPIILLSCFRARNSECKPHVNGKMKNSRYYLSQIPFETPRSSKRSRTTSLAAKGSLSQRPPLSRLAAGGPRPARDGTINGFLERVVPLLRRKFRFLCPFVG